MQPKLTNNLANNIFLRKMGFVLLLCLCYTFTSSAQKSAQDSLKYRIKVIQQEEGFSVKDTCYINLLNRLARKMRFSRTDSLRILAKQAYAHSKTSNYKYGESNALSLLGDYYSDKGNTARAIEDYTHARKIAVEIDSSSLVLNIINDLSGEHAYNGDYAKALNGYLEGIEMAKSHNNDVLLSILNENIANLYASQKDYDQALHFYEKVKKINIRVGKDLSSAETNSNLASLYADIGKLDYAMYNINQAIAVFEKDKTMDWLAYSYQVKGKIYMKQKKYKWALYWYSQSELLHEKINDDRGKIELLNEQAQAYLGQRKDSLSEVHALKAFAISNKIRFLEGIKDCAETLYKIKKNKKDYGLALTYHELFQKMSDSLSREENQKSLTLLKTKLDYDKHKEELILQNQKQLARQWNYVYAAFGILLLFFIGMIIVRRGELIQKGLNKELKIKKRILEEREKQLQESNETKDKLFSIIGHDLRGPVGALQSILRMYGEGEMDKSEFMNFIPKLRAPVDNIAFTLNNLLSWGKTQMNGTTTRPMETSLESLITANIDLLDKTAENKSIKLVNKINININTWSDGNQIDIVIRNLISNALKFTPQNGVVSIDAREKANFWEICIKDTGIGMDDSTIDKLFVKGSNFTTYGTNNEKGTGLGLSLCKEMVEKNGGTIWVESAPQMGSSFYFTVPKFKDSYKQVG